MSTIFLILFLLSMLAIFLVNVDNIGKPLSITNEGFSNYVAGYRPYRELLAATFFMLTAMLAFRQMNISNENKEITIKQNERALWIEKVKLALNTISKSSNAVYYIIHQNLSEIFERMYKKGFGMYSKSELIYFFTDFIKPNIESFEKSTDLQKYGCYEHENQMYSYNDFQIVFQSFFSSNVYIYHDILFDLEDLYLEEVKKFRIKEQIPVDSKLYNIKKMGYSGGEL